MNHKRYADEDVVCPFYKSQDSYKIRCEGIQKNSSLTLSFALPVERKQHCKDYCNNVSGFQLCPVAKMLNNKY